jgi:hypothetical protein
MRSRQQRLNRTTVALVIPTLTKRRSRAKDRLSGDNRFRHS